MEARPLVVVLGGGAAGFFAAIRAAELVPRAEVVLVEAAAVPLQKVRISGGGRCNVTHHPFEPPLALQKYPRGAKELRGALTKFGARDTMAWFESRGVQLKVEPDGRVFPTTDDSETICGALMAAAKERGVEVRTHATLTDVTRDLDLTTKDGATMRAAALVLATGSNPRGIDLARRLGHTIVPPVPSLFTFNVRDPRIDGLAGVSVPHVRAKALAGGESFEAEGPLLITHWGLSAHAVLRISAWGARAFAATGYTGTLIVDLAPETKDAAIRAKADALRTGSPRATVGAHPVVDLPRRLWERVVAAAGGDVEMRWAEVPNRGVQKLVDEIKRARFEIIGKGPFREEFVTAGGVARGEVDWRTMESRLVPGLHFAGEILDVDALTGGFNLQNAWTTGWIAGTAIGEQLRRSLP